MNSILNSSLPQPLQRRGEGVFPKGNGEFCDYSFGVAVAKQIHGFLHERRHIKQFQNSNGPSTESEMEFDAINAQREHPTWENTTEEYKRAIKSYEDFNNLRKADDE